jgi:23S rRNA-/tRNA-specific pseudouridylate synthase
MDKEDMLKPSLNLQPAKLFESDEWLVLNKPAGWLSIPGRGPGRGPGSEAGRGPVTGEPAAGQNEARPVLFDWVRSHFADAQVVHRLDLETSGVILFAKGAAAHKKASLWFQNRQTKKLYCCIASGAPHQPVFSVRSPIEGAASTTQFEVKETFSSAFLAWARPVTGRRHQIRIHLASEGAPILGDSLYSGPKILQFKTGELEIPRVALHAMSLELPSGEKFQAALPEDFESWLKRLRTES